MQVFAPDSRTTQTQHSSIIVPGSARQVQTVATRPAVASVVAARASSGPTTRPIATVPTQPPVSSNPKATPAPKTQLTTSKAPAALSGQTLFASPTSRSSIPVTAHVALPTGPDYSSVFRDAADEARYQVRKNQQRDWNRHLANEPGFQAFSNAMYKIWIVPGSTLKWDGKVSTLTLDIINNSMVVFSARNELNNLRWTLSLGADPGFNNRKGASILSGAAAWDAHDCLRYLLTEVKLNVSRRNDNGETALLQAALSEDETKKKETIDLLIASGAWLSEVDSSEENILHKLMRCGENYSGHIAIGLSILEKYGDRNIKLPDCNGFDFSQISKSHHTVLYKCFIKLTVNMENLMAAGKFNYTTATEFEYIKTILVPIIRLCKKIRELSGVSYAAMPEYQGRTAIPAIMKFSTVGEVNGIEMVKLLMLIDKPFMKSIYSDCLSAQTNKHAGEFIELYKNAEMQLTQSVFLSSSAIPTNITLARPMCT